MEGTKKRKKRKRTKTILACLGFLKWQRLRWGSPESRFWDKVLVRKRARCLLGSAFRFNITQGTGWEEGGVKVQWRLAKAWSLSQAALGLQWPEELSHVGWNDCAFIARPHKSLDADLPTKATVLGWATLQLRQSLKWLSALPHQHQWKDVVPCWEVWMALLHVLSRAQKLLFLCPDKFQNLENTVHIHKLLQNDWLLSKFQCPQKLFYWNTATIIRWHISYGCFYVKMMEWSNWDRDPLSCQV